MLGEPAQFDPWLHELILHHARPSSNVIESPRFKYPPLTEEEEEQLRGVLEHHGPAIQGHGGDQHTFAAAAKIFHDFAASEQQGWPILVAWNETCQPPWPLEDLATKMHNASKYATGPYGAKRKRDALPTALALIEEWENSGSGEPGIWPLATHLAKLQFHEQGPHSKMLRELKDKTGYSGHDLGLRWAKPRTFKIVEGEFRCTETGNAERFRQQHQGVVLWVPEWKTWLNWNGKRWVHDDGTVTRLMIETVRAIYLEAADQSDEDKRKAVAAWARASESASKIEASTRLARNLDGLSASAAAFDRDPMVLNLENGTLDLKSGQIRAHDPADRLTKISPVVFDPVATAPQFERFLARVLPSPGVRAFIQRAAGYTLTADVGEQVLFFLLGVGANGKSIFASILQDLMGEYAKPGAADLLLAKHGEAHPVEIAAIRSARGVVCSEVESGRHLAEAQVKLLTGGDALLARGMRENFFEITPTWKIWLLANHRPQVRTGGDALWRRVVMIPFDQVIPKEERDPKLREKLRAELSGILNWALQGCLDWRSQGLGQLPGEVTAAIDDYKLTSDNVTRFIDEQCVPATGAWVSSDELHTAYRDVCQSAGEFWKPKEQFGERLKTQGFVAQKRGGRRGWVGLRLRGLDAVDAVGRGFPVNGHKEIHMEINRATLAAASTASTDDDLS